MCFHVIAALYILHVEFCQSDHISCLIIAIVACEVIIMPCLNCPKYAYETTWSYRCNLFLVFFFHFFLHYVLSFIKLVVVFQRMSNLFIFIERYWTLSHLFLMWRSFISSPLCFFFCVKPFPVFCVFCRFFVFLIL